MNEEMTISVNDTMRQLAGMIAGLEAWRIGNEHCDQRHTAMVISKLEEAELLAQRMVKEPTCDA
jgi:hypothetical protein